MRWTVKVVDVAGWKQDRPVILRRAAFCLEGHVWVVHRALPADDTGHGGTWVVGAAGRALPRPDLSGVLLFGSHRHARQLVEALVAKGLRDPDQVRTARKVGAVLAFVDDFLRR